MTPKSITARPSHLHPLDWPLFPLSSLSSLQLALSFYHADYDPLSSPTLPLEIYRGWTRRRFQLELQGKHGDSNAHCSIRFNFSLGDGDDNDLDRLTSDQLLAVPWHPAADEHNERLAQKVWRRRRERDLARGLRWIEDGVGEEDVGEVQHQEKGIQVLQEQEQQPAASAPRQESPEAASTAVAATTTTPSSSSPYSPPPPSSRGSPSPVVSSAAPAAAASIAEPPPMPPLSTPLPSSVASKLSTLYLHSLPPSLTSLTLLTQIFPPHLQPTALILHRARPPLDGVEADRTAYAGWEEFEMRTQGMQELVGRRLGKGGRWRAGVELVESEEAKWEWGDFLEGRVGERFWRGEWEMSRGIEVAAPERGDVEMEMGQERDQKRDLEAEEAPPALIISQNSSAQPASPAATSARPSPAPPSTSTSTLPTDPLPPSLISQLYQLTYLLLLPSSSAAPPHHAHLKSTLPSCVGSFVLPPASYHLLPVPVPIPSSSEGQEVHIAAFASPLERNAALKVLKKKRVDQGKGRVLLPTKGVAEGWIWERLSNKFAALKRAELAAEARRGGAGKGKRPREGSEDEQEEDGVTTTTVTMDDEQEEERDQDRSTSRKLPRLDDVPAAQPAPPAPIPPPHTVIETSDPPLPSRYIIFPSRSSGAHWLRPLHRAGWTGPPDWLEAGKESFHGGVVLFVFASSWSGWE